MHEDIRLNSVTLYANGTYERSFELINEFGMVWKAPPKTSPTARLCWSWAGTLSLGPTTDSVAPRTTRSVARRDGLDLNYPYEVETSSP